MAWMLALTWVIVPICSTAKVTCISDGAEGESSSVRKLSPSEDI